VISEQIPGTNQHTTKLEVRADFDPRLRRCGSSGRSMPMPDSRPLIVSRHFTGVLTISRAELLATAGRGRRSGLISPHQSGANIATRCASA